MNQKISVIIPVYNAAPYLAKCLDSIRNQTHSDLEIICVDDGSMDNSPDILADYVKKDGRIKVIYQKNAGLSAARNTGIDAATGEWIGFVDSDDWIDANFYKELIFRAEKDGSDIVMCATKRFDDNGGFKIYPPYRRIVTSDLAEKISLLRGGGCWDKIYKTNLIRDNNLRFAEGRIYEGNLFLVQCVYYCKTMSVTVDTFYNYRLNLSGICFGATLIKKRDTDRMFTLDEIVKFTNTGGQIGRDAQSGR